jgi:Icc-related predicted phosphoesterase
MTACLFTSDLHGHEERYRKLFDRIRCERPSVVLLGGDLLPFGDQGFVRRALAAECRRLRRGLAESYPRLLLILGNDDPRSQEPALEAGEREGLWHYLHGRSLQLAEHRFYGYACIPPSPFLLKDWERYDVSRHVDAGSVSPEEGWRSVPANVPEAASTTIQDELQRLAGDDELGSAVFLFHAPPYGGLLDLADLGGREVDHAPLDPHVGSIAMRRFIEARQPLLTLHGHVHESSRLSGAWRERLGRTHSLSAAWDGPELALVRFALERPEEAERLLL